MNNLQGVITGRFDNTYEAYEYVLKEILKKKYKIIGDGKISYESRAFLQLGSEDMSKYFQLKNGEIIFLESLEKYGDKKNSIIKEECEYIYDTLFNLKKLEKAISILRKNKSSKKSIINIAAPPKPRNDKIPPCMTYISFRVINNRLNMSCHMRADNAYRILLADLFLGQFLQEEASKMLNLKKGQYYHIIDSLHMYKKEVPKLFS